MGRRKEAAQATTRIGVIGAGIAGLSCARVLVAEGHAVTLFDKGRGPGGRLSTRRVAQGSQELRFDHGAQFFTARDHAFVAEIARLTEMGAVDPWNANLVQITATGGRKALSTPPLYVGTPAMNDVVRALAQGLNVQWATRVGEIAPNHDDGLWQLQDEAGAELGAFDQIICATPAEQVAPLLRDLAPDLAAQAQAVESLPCWTGLFAFDAPLPLGFDGARFEDDPIVDFIAYGPSKPGRASAPTYVIHATSAWSTRMLEEPQVAIAQHLLAALLEKAGGMARVPSIALAHRWRYARVGAAIGSGYGYDSLRRIGVCGDWLVGPRVESAWLSGYRLGQAVAASAHEQT